MLSVAIIVPARLESCSGAFTSGNQEPSQDDVFPHSPVWECELQGCDLIKLGTTLGIYRVTFESNYRRCRGEKSIMITTIVPLFELPNQSPLVSLLFPDASDALSKYEDITKQTLFMNYVINLPLWMLA